MGMWQSGRIDHDVCWWALYMLVFFIHVSGLHTCYWALYMSVGFIHVTGLHTCLWALYMIVGFIHVGFIHDSGLYACAGISQDGSSVEECHWSGPCVPLKTECLCLTDVDMG